MLTVWGRQIIPASLGVARLCPLASCPSLVLTRCALRARPDRKSDGEAVPRHMFFAVRRAIHGAGRGIADGSPAGTTASTDPPPRVKPIDARIDGAKIGVRSGHHNLFVRSLEAAGGDRGCGNFGWFAGLTLGISGGYRRGSRHMWQVERALRTLLLVALCLVVGAGAALAKPAISAVRLGVHPEKTRLVLEFSEEPSYRVFTLPDPARVVIDLPELDWQVDPESLPPQQGPGLGSALRPLRAGRQPHRPRHHPACRRPAGSGPAATRGQRPPPCGRPGGDLG